MTKAKPKLDYAQAGVNRQGADILVEGIAKMAKGTLNSKVKSAIGGYASLYELTPDHWLAASTDGVGTKLKLAFESGNHSTVGIDLVAMSVNDLLCVGARPLFFLDYFATGKLEPQVAKQVIAGIVEGCRLAGCALVGGETAEMPDFYASGEYDLGGFAVGSLSPRQALPRPKIGPGLVLIGLRSTGLHSNGFSLVRKLLDRERKSVTRAQLKTRVSECLTPTQIYSGSLLGLLEKRWIEGAAHITGSGYLNVPRISTEVDFEIQLPSSRNLPAVFSWLKKVSGLDFGELAQTFNMGLGMILAVEPQKVRAVLGHLKKCKQQAWVVGRTLRKTAGSKKVSRVFLTQQGSQDRVELIYD